jgi:hypothetical protein
MSSERLFWCGKWLDVCGLQGRQLTEASREADRVRAEVAAQQLALVAMAGERDACRTSVTEANERCKVRC